MEQSCFVEPGEALKQLRKVANTNLGFYVLTDEMLSDSDDEELSDTSTEEFEQECSFATRLIPKGEALKQLRRVPNDPNTNLGFYVLTDQMLLGTDHED